MNVRINGEAQVVPDGLTVSSLLSHLGISAGQVAVEVNAQVIRKALHPEHRLAEGDEVEIVTFVGGGSPSVPEPETIR